MKHSAWWATEGCHAGPPVAAWSSASAPLPIMLPMPSTVGIAIAAAATSPSSSMFMRMAAALRCCAGEATFPVLALP